MPYDEKLNKEINDLVGKLKIFSKECRDKDLSDAILYQTWILLIKLNNKYNFPTQEHLNKEE